MDVPSLRRIVVLLLLVLVNSHEGRAGTDSILVCPRFVRVTRANEISENGRYLLVNVYKKVWRALSSHPYKNKLLAQPLSVLREGEDNAAPDTIGAPVDSCIWLLHKVGESYALRSLADGRSTGKGTEALTDVLLTSDSERALPFKLSFAEGRLILTAGDRNLRFSGYDDSYYGLYKASSAGYEDPYLYKVSYDTLATGEESVAAGKYVCAIRHTGAVRGLLLSEEGTRLVDISDFCLQNGRVAADVPATVCRPSADVFFFRGFALKKSAGAPAALSYKKDNGSDIHWRSTDSIDGLVYDYVSIFPIENAAQAAYGDNALTLTGGWSRCGLQNLSLSDTLTELDLTGAVLPAKMPQLACANPNVVVYVSSFQEEALASSRLSVVVGEDNGPMATSGWELQDNHPFKITKDIRFLKNCSPTYSRVMPDNYWQTLYLPFELTAIPAGISLFVVEEINDERVMLRPVQRLDAYTPALFCWSGERGQGVTFRTSATELHPEPLLQENALTGTLETTEYHFKEPWMVLGPDGKTFVQAAEGSFIAPFRALLRTDAPRLRIMMRPTAVGRVTESGTDAPAYDLTGRRVASGYTGWRIANRKIMIKR